MSHISKFLPYNELQKLALSGQPEITISDDGYWVINGVKTDTKAEVEVPVQSVNGQTGDVVLTASDVGARPSTWTPSATEVGARPNTWTPTYADVGAEKSGAAASAVISHNTNTGAHNDIRLELKALADRINAALDSDDTTLDELSEIVAYIKSNKDLIDAITTSKVSVSDIVDNLTSNISSKPLSAAQGVALKSLIDALRDSKLDASALTSAINTALAQAKASGEFDGADGKDGKDGTSVTVSSIESTTASGGANKVNFSNGKSLTVYNGKTPVYGVDYFRGSEINSFKDAILNEIGTPMFGRVESSASGNTVILSGKDLDTGEYKIYYDMGADKDPVYIGLLEIDNNEYVDVILPADRTGFTLSNASDRAAVGFEYTNTITAKDGYKLTSVAATMNNSTSGITITGDESSKTITIASVTGNIVIDAVATAETVVNCSVTNTLTKCSTNNSATTVAKGNSYSATISPNENCVITSITVTMDGTNITSSAVSGNAISIGNVTGNIVITAKAVTNQIPISTDANGNTFVGENGGLGYKNGYRLSTSSGGEKKEAPNHELTGFIPCTYYSTLYVKNITTDASTLETCCWYDENKNYIAGGYTYLLFGTVNGEVASGKTSAMSNDVLIANKDKVAFIRIVAREITENSILTVDEPIS